MRGNVVLAAASVVLASGCASITNSKLQPVSVMTVMDNKEVTNVGCSLSNDEGKWFVTTPGSVTVQKSTADLAIDCKKKDVGAGTEMVESSANGSVWGNLLVGGLIGYAVDRNTGAGFDYPNTITVTLRPYETVQPQASEPLKGQPSEASRPAETAAVSVQAKTPTGHVLATAAAAATLKPPLQTGQDSFQVQKMAKASACAPDPLATLTGKGPGFENYSVNCSDGDVQVYRCEFGNCRVLK